MNCKSVLMIISSSLLLFSCSGPRTDRELFNGEIHYVNDESAVSRNVVSQQVLLDGIYTGMIAVHDSLLVCWEPSYQSHFVNLFNIDTGKEIGLFCPQGQGPNEFSNTNPVYQFFKKGDDLMSLFDGNLRSLFFWNITKSIQTKTTVYDTIMYDKGGLGLFFYYLPDGALLNVISSKFTDDRNATTPYCERRSLYTEEGTQLFPIYKSESVSNKSASNPVGRFFNTWDALKPDGTKLVQAMSYLPQLNIIDTNTGQVVGYRLEDGTDYSLVQTDMKNLKRYYLSVQADDKYIYAAYWGKESWGSNPGNSIPKFDQIYVFDWSGNLLYKLKTDRSYYIIWLDTVRNRLYTRDWNTDEIYYLDLNELDF